MASLKIGELKISSTQPSIIPSIFDVKASSPSGTELIFEYHEEMDLSYSIGEEILLRISTEKIEPLQPTSLCGKATLYSVKQKEGKLVYLFSAGGLILRISSPEQLSGLEISEDYYFCIDKPELK